MRQNEIREISKERKKRRFRVMAGSLIAAIVGAVVGLLVGYWFPHRESGTYPYHHALALAATIPPMHQAALAINQRKPRMTPVGVVITVIAFVSFFVGYVVGANNAPPVFGPAILYGVVDRGDASQNGKC